jgi:hypothetical protein
VLLVVGGRPTRSRLPAHVTIRATLLYLPVWLLLGASFWLCARGLVTVPADDLALYMGAFTVAWLAGLLAIYRREVSGCARPCWWHCCTDGSAQPTRSS